MMRYCFVIPVYNHPDYLTDLLQYLKQFELPIIVVNDGSHASCTAQLQQLDQQHEQMILLEHADNMGKGQAVMTAIRHAHLLGFSHALQLDADGQHHWQDIARFIQTSQAHPEAMVIGQAMFDQSVPRKRLYGRYLTHIWVWINSLSFDIKDSMCGFRVYPVAACMQVLDQHRLHPRMGFDSEILVRLKWQGVDFVNLPTHVVYPEGGISHFNMLRDNIGLSQTHTRLFFGMLKRLPRLSLQKVHQKKSQKTLPDRSEH